MLIGKCEICGNSYLLNYSVGMSYFFPVCCEECLVQYIRNIDSKEIKPGTYFDGEFCVSEFNGKHFRSDFENIVYNNLSKHFKVIYEPFLFTSGCKQYVPDFYLPEKGIFIEAKGKRVTRYRKISYFNKFVPIYLITREFGRLMGWI